MEQAGWGKWVKQLISMVLTKFSQNTSFNSYVSDFCSSSSVHASALLCVCHTVKDKGFQWVLTVLPGERASLSHTHTLIRGREKVSLAWLLGTAVPPVLTFWFSSWLDAFAVSFANTAWLLNWSLLWKFSLWQIILQFDTAKNLFLSSFL